MPIRSIFENGFTRIGAAQPELNVSFAQDITYKKLGRATCCSTPSSAARS
jgi:hypothetical protein